MKREIREIGVEEKKVNNKQELHVRWFILLDKQAGPISLEHIGILLNLCRKMFQQLLQRFV